MGLKIFLDTNIIIYFLEKNNKFFNKVLPYFRKAETKDVELYTSSLSYMELLIPVIKNKDVNLEAKYNFLFKNFFNVVNIDMETARIGAKIRAGYGIRTPDALQIACAIRSNCKQFITSDRRLKKISGIEIVVIS